MAEQYFEPMPMPDKPTRRPVEPEPVDLDEIVRRIDDKVASVVSDPEALNLEREALELDDNRVRAVFDTNENKQYLYFRRGPKRYRVELTEV
jgi:hypothetical protein